MASNTNYHGTGQTMKNLGGATACNTLYRSHAPKHASYFGTGGGRDSYIILNNGGLSHECKNHMMSKLDAPVALKGTAQQMVGSQMQATGTLKKEPMSVRYRSNGSGRDSYVLMNSGGMQFDHKLQRSSPEQAFKDDLRNDQTLRYDQPAGYGIHDSLFQRENLNKMVITKQSNKEILRRSMMSKDVTARLTATPNRLPRVKSMLDKSQRKHSLPDFIQDQAKKHNMQEMKELQKSMRIQYTKSQKIQPIKQADTFMRFAPHITTMALIKGVGQYNPDNARQSLMQVNDNVRQNTTHLIATDQGAYGRKVDSSFDPSKSFAQNPQNFIIRQPPMPVRQSENYKITHSAQNERSKL